MQIGIHPAPGFGELLPAGTFVVPQNPIVPVRYVPSIGELLPASFTLPENPVARELSGLSSLRPGVDTFPANIGHPDLDAPGILKPFTGEGHAYGRGHPVMKRTGWGRNVSVSGLAGCGCISGMCGEQCEGLAGLGMGQLPGLESIGSFLPWILGGGILLWMLTSPGGSAYRQERARAESEYRSKVAGIRRKHRGYRRIARGAAGAAQRGLQAVQAA